MCDISREVRHSPRWNLSNKLRYALCKKQPLLCFKMLRCSISVFESNEVSQTRRTQDCDTFLFSRTIVRCVPGDPWYQQDTVSRCICHSVEAKGFALYIARNSLCRSSVHSLLLHRRFSFFSFFYCNYPTVCFNITNPLAA